MPSNTSTTREREGSRLCHFALRSGLSFGYIVAATAVSMKYQRKKVGETGKPTLFVIRDCVNQGKGLCNRTISTVQIRDQIRPSRHHVIFYTGVMQNQIPMLYPEYH